MTDRDDLKAPRSSGDLRMASPAPGSSGSTATASGAVPSTSEMSGVAKRSQASGSGERARGTSGVATHAEGADASRDRQRTQSRKRWLGNLRFLRQRLLLYVTVAFISVLLNFILPRFMPGDPATQMIRDITNKTGTPPSAYQIQLIKARYGDPDRNVFLQFWDYISQIAQGDLGLSSQYYPIPVVELISRALPWTLYLAVTSTILGWIIGTYLGARLGWKPGRRFDAVLTPLAMFFSSIPAFWLGLLIVWYFAYSNGWFPNQGSYDNALTVDLTNPDFLLSVLQHSVLPFFTLILVGFARWLFSMRNMMITTVNEDYVQLARAKGLRPERVRSRYAARNALLPNFTGLAQSMGGALTAVILAEAVFIYPGIGSLLQGAQTARDYPVLQGVMLMVIFASLTFNFIADSVYVLLDPRTKEAQ